MASERALIDEAGARKGNRPEKADLSPFFHFGQYRRSGCEILPDVAGQSGKRCAAIGAPKQK